MFKKIMVSVVSTAIFMSGMPIAEAGTFGSRSSASSSRSTAAAPRATPSPSPARNINSGGISRGGAIGMTRSDVSNRVRNGTITAPANETTVAGKNPGGAYNYNNRTAASNSGSYYGGGSGYNNPAPAPQPSRGHSTGALIGAAAAGAIGGYMLNGLMHNRDGSVYNGPGYNNGVPIPGYNPNTVPQGYNDNSVPQSYNNGYANPAPVTYAPVQRSSGGGSFIWSLLGLLLIASLIYFMWKTFFSKKTFNNGTNEGVGMFNSYSSAPVETKSPEAELRDMKENLFSNFQKNNKPSGLNYIQQNSEPMFFDAIRDMVMEGSDSRTITIRSLEAQLVDITQDGSRFIGSVVYKGTVVETEVGGEPVATNINEMWNFVYTNGGWKVAGIEPLN